MPPTEEPSEGLKSLLEHEKKLKETLKLIEQQLYGVETHYFEDTPHGNVVRGWEGFAENKPIRKDNPLKKNRVCAASDRLFSNSSISWMQPAPAEVSDVGETPVRRRSSASKVSGSKTGSKTGSKGKSSKVKKRKREQPSEDVVRALI